MDTFERVEFKVDMRNAIKSIRKNTSGNKKLLPSGAPASLMRGLYALLSKVLANVTRSQIARELGVSRQALFSDQCAVERLLRYLLRNYDVPNMGKRAKATEEDDAKYWEARLAQQRKEGAIGYISGMFSRLDEKRRAVHLTDEELREVATKILEGKTGEIKLTVEEMVNAINLL